MVVDATDVLKPRTDTRDYRCVGLGNALQALIISDPETDKVASHHLIGTCSQFHFEIRLLFEKMMTPLSAFVSLLSRFGLSDRPFAVT